MVPEIAKYIANLESGEVSPIFTFNNLYTFIRLEYFSPAQLDEKTSMFLIDELFDRWVQQNIARKISSLTSEVKLITPEFEDDLLMANLDRSSRIDSFDSEQRDWVRIELSPKPPQANICPPLVGLDLKSPQQRDRTVRSISNLSRLVFYLLSLVAVSSVISMNWEYFKLHSNPVNLMIDNDRFDRANRD